MHTMIRARWMLAFLLGLLPVLAHAEVRAWLDRDRVALGETVTLNIETDGGGQPDYAPLAADFALSQHASRQLFERRAGQQVSRMLFAVALEPQRAGSLTVPALRVGSERTVPLALSVVAAAAPARARGNVFIEAEVDAPAPYVQQAVGYTLRLYYATQLISGQLDLPPPEGASLQRVGSDVQYNRDIGGRRYTVVERRYLLLPERSGALVLPGARFEGRGVGNLFDDIFSDGQRALSARGPDITLDVRAMPATAPRPWLPLRALSMRWVDPPRTARVGDATTVELEIVADGAMAAQLAAPTVDADQGAQVFAEPAQVDETVRDGRPHVRLLRRFSVLPARDGRMRVVAPTIAWWDVASGQAREAVLPDLTLDVAPAPGARADADGAAVAAAPAPGDGDPWVRVPGVQGEVRAWALATVAFALLWLVTLGWALQQRQRAAGVATDASTRVAATAGHTPSATPRALRRALDTGDLGDVAHALCAFATPPAADLDALADRIEPGPQRAAIALLQQARWGGGDAASARTAVRAAFAAGARWQTASTPADADLPPLYPS
ncbi:BatD family protein [Luteimonas sp. MC1825]|uniref:BatD family protein n=1 Tax=Luteimonas sp. MC1825 TaxID=2761107 RepID=UPI001CC70A4C|nr:BatD family protein [Luteimonas sp. MC1825]